MERYKYEREAARGDVMPDGLTLMEQYAYQAMRNLYGSYRKGLVTKDQAVLEKRRILKSLKQALEKEAFRDKTEKHTASLWKAIESAAARYKNERTLESADAFMEAVYGVKLKHDRI